MAAAMMVFLAMACLPSASWAERCGGGVDGVWLGDLDGIADRGRLRVLTAWSKTHYFFDGPRPRGVVYEGFEAFRTFLNDRLGRRKRPISIVYIPLPGDELIPALLAGRGDVVAANLTETESRGAKVAFTTPVLTGVRELLVTGPGMPGVESLDDLAGRTVVVRHSSSYRESLEAANQSLAARGLTPIDIRIADEQLEDEDILQLVSIGSYPATVADDHIADFWEDVYDGLVVHEDIAFREGGRIAHAVRKTSPKLRAELDAFLAAHKKGTLFGNVILKRYLRANRWARNPVSFQDTKRFQELAPIFRRYSDQYELDWLLVAAQGYQESGLDNAKRSHVGAVGIMQLMPATARSPEVDIPNFEELDANVHAGAKYLRHLMDHYFADPEIGELDRILFALAAYNAGPTRMRRLRAEAEQEGLDPHQWFENVEIVAARRVGREPVQYVENIYNYHIAYGLLRERNQKAAEAKKKP
ncbi:MAG: transporter substrate-binding domain-containing protein [Deltaproteobacteria bacterium]|nr:transporter substrate-binding domain-containing protein [Deltaproteobacteria bacterium]